MLDNVKQWQAQRHAELSAPDSWLGLVGLFWLAPGTNRVGSGDECPVHLPGGPAHLGDLLWTGDAVFWQPVGSAPQPIATDRDAVPTTVEYQNWSFFVADRSIVAERGTRLAARVRDRDWAVVRPFGGLDYFAIDPAWCIEAKWQALSPPLTMEVPNVTGDLVPVEVTHQAVFDYDGQKHALLPMSVGESEVFFVFRDRTSGRESYGAGRFLKAVAPVDGKITLDFNRAYNPPCAFTSFATCPLPPPENWLPFAIPAGEKKWVKTD
jgi:uncharacterized protein (DUF1684 family)